MRTATRSSSDSRFSQHPPPRIIAIIVLHRTFWSLVGSRPRPSDTGCGQPRRRTGLPRGWTPPHLSSRADSGRRSVQMELPDWRGSTSFPAERPGWEERSTIGCPCVRKSPPLPWVQWLVQWVRRPESPGCVGTPEWLDYLLDYPRNCRVWGLAPPFGVQPCHVEDTVF